MLRALSFIMKDTFRDIIIHIPSLHNPVRQIDVFAIHKERLVQQPHFIQRFTTKDEQNILKNCQRALKKNQSAAQKVEKQIEKLESKPYLTPAEDQELKALKKQKLDGKTRLHVMLDRYEK